MIKNVLRQLAVSVCPDVDVASNKKGKKFVQLCRKRLLLAHQIDAPVYTSPGGKR